MPKQTANGADTIQQKAASDASAVQDGVNLIAIVGCFHRHLIALSRSGASGDDLINHPVSLAFTSKVNSLCRMSLGREMAALSAIDRIEKPLGESMELYWTWFPGRDQEGRVKKVVFLPLPEGSPVDEDCPFVFVGEEDFSLRPGVKFVLPMFVFVGEMYANEDPPDDPEDFPEELFTSADVLITLDGKSILDSDVDDLSDFFFDTRYFDPPISYGNDTGAIGAIWVKGIGFVHMPLSKGQHTLTLFVDTGIELDPENYPGCTLVFANSWNLTVEK